MNQWYYLDEERQQLETDEDALRRLAASGELRPDTLVWNESMTEWAPLQRALSGKALSLVPTDETGTQTRPYQAPVNGNRGSGNIHALAAILARQAGWTRALAVLSLCAGILTLPILVGIIPLWLSLLLFQIASQAEEATRTGREQTLSRALEKAALAYKLTSIFVLIVCVAVLAAGGVATAFGALAFLLGRNGAFAP